jgi:signal transduction histidine kinase/integral membrane sensor domain MASE1/CheY-like chemotaxis protein
LLVLTALYVLAGKLGLTLAIINPSASPVWPPTGLALASMLLVGRHVWPAIFVGAFLVNYTTAAAILPSLGIAVGNTLEALVGAYLVRRFASGCAAFDRTRDFFRFVVLAGFLSTAISATVGTTTLTLAGAVVRPHFASVWLTWWLANAAGNVVVAPLLILWTRTPRLVATPSRWIELTLLTFTTVAVGAIVFVKTSYPVEFLSIPLCVWAGARFGPREASTATAILSGVAVWAATRGAGPFASETANSALLLTQMFVVVAQIAGLGIAAAVLEMTSAHDMLRCLKDDLEARVMERTAELQTSQALLADAQNVAHLGSWQWDVPTGHLLWSEETYRIYGVSPGAFQPSYETFVAMVHAEDRPTVEEAAKRAMADGESFEFEFRLLRADGVARIGFSRGRAVRDVNGHPVRLVGTLQDVTDQKQLDTRLRQAQKLEALGLLAGGIAHDFNNLITAMGGYTELTLAEMDRRDPRYDDLLEVRKAADRAAALTRRLLAFSRTQALLVKVVDVNGVVANLEHLLRRTIGEHIDLVLTLAPTLDPVRVDPDQLEQVVLNIALNARDAMVDGGELRFTTAAVEMDETAARQHPPMAPGRYIRLSIADTGVGMAPEVQARIFEPFFTTKPQDQGTGFGLATVYGIVKQSGGYISVTSVPRQGTTFDVYLPRITTNLIASGLAEPKAPASGSSGETILIVEDDGAVRRLARDILTEAGYAIIEARDGEEALSRTLAHPSLVDLVITDVVMPGLTGRELAARLAEAFPTIRVLYTSGYAKAATLTAGIDGTAPFLPKPFLPTDLLDKVRQILNHAPGMQDA